MKEIERRHRVPDQSRSSHRAGMEGRGMKEGGTEGEEGGEESPERGRGRGS